MEKERKKKEKSDNAIVRVVCPVCYYLHEQKGYGGITKQQQRRNFSGWQGGRETAGRVMEKGGRGRGKYVQARVCGIDRSYHVRVLLNNTLDDTLSKSTSMLLLSGGKLDK